MRQKHSGDQYATTRRPRFYDATTSLSSVVIRDNMPLLLRSSRELDAASHGGETMLLASSGLVLRKLKC